MLNIFSLSGAQPFVWRVRILVTCLVCAIAATLNLRGEDATPNSASSVVSDSKNDEAHISLIAGLSSLRDIFAGVKSLEYKAVTDRPFSKNYIQGKLHVIFSGDHYWYDYDPGHVPGASPNAVIAGYDGNYWQTLHKDTMFLTLTRSGSADALYLTMANYLFQPFAYFAKEDRNDHCQFLLKPSDLADEVRWKDFTSSLQLVGPSTINNTPVIAVDIDAKPECFTRNAATIRFYLDPKSKYYPIAWDALTKDGKMIISYRVSTLGWLKMTDSLQLPYPKQATISYFYIRDQGTVTLKETANPLLQTTVQIESIAVNKKISGDGCSIDPAIASTVYDVDHKVFIPIPK